MANVYAVKTGNWSDATVWNTGALPTGSDNVYSNNFTVTIDTSVTVLSLSSAGASGISAGGGFSVTSSKTIACTSYISTGSSAALTINTGNASTVIVNAPTVYAGSGGQLAIKCIGSGTYNITGNFLGGDGGATAAAIAISETAIVNITGNLTGGGGGGVACTCGGYSVVTVTGELKASTGNSVGAHGIVAGDSATLTVIGNITGGYFSTDYNSPNVGLYISSNTVNVTHTGTIFAYINSPGLWGPIKGGLNIKLSGPFISSNNGTNPLYVGSWRWTAAASPTYYQVRTSDLSNTKTLYTSDSTLSNSGQPAASNVRSGIIYGPSSELVGTCAVPLPGNVALSVPVDNTTGTAVLSATAVKEACSKAIVPALIALG
jgi:hypothetical protein